MRLAIDLSPLQNAHRMRGIGFTLINFLNNIPEDFKTTNEFVFYVLPEGEALFADPFEAIDVSDFNYSVRSLKQVKRLPFRLPGRFNLPIGLVNRIIRFHSFYFGDSRVGRVKDIDVFLQADQNHALPRGRGFKKVMIIYDLIPQILDWDYLNRYKSARGLGRSRTKSLILAAKRKLLINKIRRNTKKADRLIAISETTKKDFTGFLGTPAKKIAVVPLGVTSPQVSSDEVRLHKYIDTGWGYAKRPFKLDDTPYLLFIGGVDSRRKLEDLVAAFNNLRAKGNHLRLILAGDIMLGPSAITNKVVADSLAKSSYLDDIVFMGFIDDSQKYLLYEKALAYVFPSRYEGFGLPILEAMIHGCPVISYKSQAVAEVGGDFPVYADNLKELEQAIVNLLQVTKSAAKERARRYVKVAEGYSWQRTATGILKVIYNSK